LLTVADLGEGNGRPAPPPPPSHLILGEKRIAEGRKTGRASKKNKNELPLSSRSGYRPLSPLPPFSSRSGSATAVN